MELTRNITTTRLVIIVAAFLTLVGNGKFFSETVIVFPLQDNVLFIASLSVWLFSFLSILLLLVCYKYSVKPILIALLLTSSIVSYVANAYGIVLDDNMITNTLETNPLEVLDLFSFKFLLYFVILGVIPSYLVYIVHVSSTTWKQQLWSKTKTITVMAIVFVMVTLSFSKAYTSLAREQRHLRLYVNPTYYLYAIGKYVNSRFATAAVPFKKIGTDAVIDREDQTRKLIIMIAGEAARSDRFSLNGYKRTTNPLLEKEEVISLNQMYSCGTDTALSVPCMFSSLNKDDYSHAQGKNMSNVLDVLNYAGVEVLWRDNNSSSKSVASRLPFEDYKSSSINSVCDPECRDQGMLSDLQKYINAHKEKDIVVILHTMGSHGPAYYKRYPEQFEKFTPVCETNQLNECSNEQINNAYDNTIVYTDYVLAKTIELLKNNQDSFKTAMFYMSDHGESLGENGLYLHGMPYFMAPDEQIHVGSMLWFDERFSKDINIDELKSIANKKLSHDNIFHTLLGLMNIKTTVYNEELDFIPYFK